jgi:hypothetical protein
MADQDGARAAKVFFSWCEIAAELGLDLQNLQEAGCHQGFAEAFGKLTGNFGNILQVIAGYALQCGVQSVPFFEANRSDEGFRTAGASVGEAEELIARGEWQGAKKDCVDGGKDGAVGADGKSQSDDDSGGEGRRSAEAPTCLAKAAEHGVEEGVYVHVTGPFEMSVESPKPKTGEAGCFVRRETSLLQLFRTFGEMKGEFALQVTLQGLGPEQVAQTMEQGHRITPLERRAGQG